MLYIFVSSFANSNNNKNFKKRQSLAVLCLWVLSIVRVLNSVCVIVERSHVFSLRAEEKDLSPAACSLISAEVYIWL